MNYLRFLAVLTLLTITSCANPTIEKNGGIKAVIEVPIDDFLKSKLRNPRNGEFQKVLSGIDESEVNVINAFVERYSQLSNGKPCVRIFDYVNIEGITQSSSNKELRIALRKEFDQSVDVLQHVLLARLDKLNIPSASIEKREDYWRLAVTVPEVKDVKFIGEVLSRKAEFGLYETYTLAQIGESWSTMLATDRPIDTLTSDELLFEESEGDDSERKSELENKIHSFGGSSICLVEKEHKDWVMTYLEKESISAHFPADLTFMLGNELEVYEVNGKEVKGFMLYAIREPFGGKPKIGSEHIQEAKRDYNSYDGDVVVALSMTTDGASAWEKMTSDNLGKVIAITLDRRVYSAPVVNGVITGGRSEIDGSFTVQEVENLVNMLNTGAIPVSYNVIELELVAPSK